MSQQMIPYGTKIKTFRDTLEKLKPQLAMALPRHITAAKMMRVVMTTVQRTPALLDCTDATILGAVLQCSQMGLSPDPLMGESYLVPFVNRKKGITECTLIVGYRGMIKLARQTGQISTIYAEAVFDGDEFVYEMGLEPILKHVPSEAEEREKQRLTHVYAVARFKDGGAQFVVLPVSKVNAIRERSRAAGSGPWVTDYEAMAKKTAVKQLAKWLPQSSELATAVGLDDRADASVSQDLGDFIETTAEPVNDNDGPPKTLDDLAKKKEVIREPGDEG